MIISNQIIGLAELGHTRKEYVFTEAEFEPDRVPVYAFHLKHYEENGVKYVSFQCEFDRSGQPVRPKEADKED